MKARTDGETPAGGYPKGLRAEGDPPERANASPSRHDRQRKPVTTNRPR